VHDEQRVHRINRTAYFRGCIRTLIYEIRPESKFRLPIKTSKIYISKKQKNVPDYKVKIVYYFST